MVSWLSYWTCFPSFTPQQESGLRQHHRCEEDAQEASLMRPMSKMPPAAGQRDGEAPGVQWPALLLHPLSQGRCCAGTCLMTN